MGIGSITSTNSVNSMSGMQMHTTDATDQKSKKIQNDIADAKQQIQKLSSKEELSVDEKANERKKLQQEISGLDTKLKQHQEELLRSQKREAMLAELREDTGLAKTGKPEDKTQTDEISSDQADKRNLPNDEQQAGQQGTVVLQNSDGTVILKEEMNSDETRGINTENNQAKEAKEEEKDRAEEEKQAMDDETEMAAGFSYTEVRELVSADSSVQQANRQGAIITNTRDGIAVLKGEINQDEKRGVDTERKEAELEKMEKQEQRATAIQFSVLGEAIDTKKSAADTNVVGLNDKAQVHVDNNANANAQRMSQEEQAAQQRFYVSFG